MSTLKVLSYNIKGLNSPGKRAMFRNEIRRLGGQVIFVQETHIKPEKQSLLTSSYFPYAYASSAPTSKSRGVSIWIAKSVPWELIEIKSDGEGRWLGVKGRCFGRLVTFGTIYAPNKGQIGFIENAIDKLMEFAEGILVMGGDLNLAMNPELDTSTGRLDISKSWLRKFKKALLDRQIIDVWRMLHPYEKDYYFYSATHKTYGRLDYFLLRHIDMPRVKKVDHSPVSLLLEWVEPAPRQLRWRLNESLIQNEDSRKKIREELEVFFKCGTRDSVEIP